MLSAVHYTVHTIRPLAVMYGYLHDSIFSLYLFKTLKKENLRCNSLVAERDQITGTQENTSK